MVWQFLRVVLGLVAVAAISFSPLARMVHQANAAECTKRRRLLTAEDYHSREARRCPVDGNPFLHAMTADSSVVIISFCGTAQPLFDRAAWVSIQ